MTTHCQLKLLSHHQRFLLAGTELGSARLLMQGSLLEGQLTAAHGNIHKWHTVGRGSLCTFSSMLTRTRSLPQSRSAAYFPTLLRSRRLRSVVHRAASFLNSIAIQNNRRFVLQIFRSFARGVAQSRLTLRGTPNAYHSSTTAQCSPVDKTNTRYAA